MGAAVLGQNRMTPIRVITGLSLGLGFLSLSSGLFMSAKAGLSSILLERAWAQSTEAQIPVSPWRSLDALPYARLSVPGTDISRVVLDRASGQALAFAPGFVTGSYPVGHPGSSAIAAHKNTHFAFLKDLTSGDHVQVELLSGKTVTYRVKDIEIINSDTDDLYIQSAFSELVLITCYPFDALSFGGPMRYVVRAEKVRPIFQTNA